MNTPALICGAGIMAAIVVGVITIVVSSMVLIPKIGSRGLLLGLCVGCLCALGLLSNTGGGVMSALLIPYEALGIAILFVLFLKFFWSDDKPSKKQLPTKVVLPPRKVTDDPWDAELRKNGPKVQQFRKQIRTRH